MPGKMAGSCHISPPFHEERRPRRAAVLLCLLRANLARSPAALSTCDEPPEGIVQPVQCADDTFRDSREPIGREQESQDEKRHTADRVMLEHEQAHGNHGQHPGGQRQNHPVTSNRNISTATRSDRTSRNGNAIILNISLI